MGPSGAGKTTLLNMLTCENTRTPVGTSPSTATSTAKYYRDHCAYVRQDSLWPFMTTYDTSSWQKLYNRGTNIREQTEFLIKSMGLLSHGYACQEASGGQRRRLSLAMAMAKIPRCSSWTSRPPVLTLPLPRRL